MVEDLLKHYPTTCTLRVRMPISDDLSHRNFVTKIVKYDRVVNIPNSMTTLTDMLPVSLVMAERKLTGIYNFCNPGAISHNEVLDLYKKYIDPAHTYTNFSVDEQAKILKVSLISCVAQFDFFIPLGHLDTSTTPPTDSPRLAQL